MKGSFRGSCSDMGLDRCCGSLHFGAQFIGACHHPVWYLCWSFCAESSTLKWRGGICFDRPPPHTRRRMYVSNTKSDSLLRTAPQTLTTCQNDADTARKNSPVTCSTHFTASTTAQICLTGQRADTRNCDERHCALARAYRHVCPAARLHHIRDSSCIPIAAGKVSGARAGVARSFQKR
jgi:hypothetical protein